MDNYDSACLSLNIEKIKELTPYKTVIFDSLETAKNFEHIENLNHQFEEKFDGKYLNVEIIGYGASYTDDNIYIYKSNDTVCISISMEFITVTQYEMTELKNLNTLF